MKKNRMMRLASVLLVAVLMTTCTISGTFAKYVTQGSADDEARVAKFGVNVASNGYLFSTGYVEKADGNIPGDTDLTVFSSTGEDVLAPGTKSNDDGMVLSMTGTPEVSVEVAYTAAVTLTGWEVDGVYYCPLVFTIDGVEYNGTTYASAALFEDALEGAITGQTASYTPNTDLGAQGSGNVQISWEWPFSVDDAKDTKLGDQAAAGTAARVDFELGVTVTQID